MYVDRYVLYDGRWKIHLLIFQCISIRTDADPFNLDAKISTEQKAAPADTDKIDEWDAENAYDENEAEFGKESELFGPSTFEDDFIKSSDAGVCMYAAYLRVGLVNNQFSYPHLNVYMYVCMYLTFNSYQKLEISGSWTTLKASSETWTPIEIMEEFLRHSFPREC